MSDLDRKICEAKGYRVETRGNLTMILPPEDAKPPFKDEPPEWSTSDAKALDLVDELLAAPGTRTPSFKLEFHDGGIEKWSAQFRLHYFQDHQPAGFGNTRAEAICRAYLAAREWMAGRSKA